MSKEDLIEWLWWDLRSLGLDPEDKRLSLILIKAYDAGRMDGEAEYED